MKRRLMWIAMFGLSYLAIELFAFFGLHVLKTTKGIAYRPISRTALSSTHQRLLKLYLRNDTYIVHSPELGWTVRPGAESGLYRANRQGFRAEQEYAPGKPESRFRITTFGDSFTHGDEVPNAQTWQAQAESLRADLEIINFGVSGYGVDQAYLRYELQGAAFETDVLIIGVMPGDVRRHVNVFRPFLHSFTGLPLAKPRFLLRNNNLTLLPNPLPSLADYERLLVEDKNMLPALGADDMHYQKNYDRFILEKLPSVRLTRVLWHQWQQSRDPDRLYVDGILNPHSRAHELTVLLFSRFASVAEQHGAKPVVLLFPTKKELEIFNRRQVHPYRSLVNALRSKGLHVLDLLPAFVDRMPPGSFEPLFHATHYSPEGNLIVATELLRELTRLNLLPSDGSEHISSKN